MLPGKCLYRNLNCPFYEFELCVRPYCHFRHQKKPEKVEKNEEEEQQIQKPPEKQPSTSWKPETSYDKNIIYTPSTIHRKHAPLEYHPRSIRRTEVSVPEVQAPYDPSDVSYRPYGYSSTTGNLPVSILTPIINDDVEFSADSDDADSTPSYSNLEDLEFLDSELAALMSSDEEEVIAETVPPPSVPVVEVEFNSDDICKKGKKRRLHTLNDIDHEAIRNKIQKKEESIRSLQKLLAERYEQQGETKRLNETEERVAPPNTMKPLTETVRMQSREDDEALKEIDRLLSEPVTIIKNKDPPKKVETTARKSIEEELKALLSSEDECSKSESDVSNREMDESESVVHEECSILLEEVEETKKNEPPVYVIEDTDEEDPPEEETEDEEPPIETLEEIEEKEVKVSKSKLTIHVEDVEIVETKTKKRSAHTTEVYVDHDTLRQKVAFKKSNRPSSKSLQKVLAERYEKKSKEKENNKVVQPAPTIPGLKAANVKIAAVPNVARLLQEKKLLEERLKGIKARSSDIKTVKKNSQRVAHDVREPDRSQFQIQEGSRTIPKTVRQHCFDRLYKEMTNVYPSKSEAIEEAKTQERVFFSNNTSLKSYQCSFANFLLKLKRRINNLQTNVNGRQGKNYTTRELYERLLVYKLSEEDMVKNGYPMKKGKTTAVCKLDLELHYNKKYNYIKRTDVDKRYCIRCSKVYEVDPVTLEQLKVAPNICIYHPGRRVRGNNGERVYSCCNTMEGCTMHTKHVTDSNDYENYPNCVSTYPKRHDFSVYGLDCEMVYTRLGYELARVTVIDVEKKVVYDTLVQPEYEIECYNTQYSGLTQEMLQNVKVKLKDVHNELLKLFSEDTILIGHSLDSDLRALHLIHKTVVDTSITFPSNRGPFKRALKELSISYLKKIIQENVGGHDSTEDAVTALELMLYKVKEDYTKFEFN